MGYGGGLMDWITEHVAIGNYLEAVDAALLRRHGFRSAISLDGTLAGPIAEELGLEEIVTVRLIDGAGNDPRHFRSAVNALVRLANTHPPVLVQCHAGRSRSVIVVAGFLVASQQMEPHAATEFVATRREVNVTPELFSLLDEL
jgi:protein-tyrosine phosphatase